MTPCRDLNDGGALPGLCKSGYWSREIEEWEWEREKKNNEKQEERWEIWWLKNNIVIVGRDIP